MADLLQDHRQTIADLVGLSLVAIRDALAAGKYASTPQGLLLDLGVDHYARMTGVKRLTEMVQAARCEDDRPQGQTITYEMFLTILREADSG